MITGDGHHAFKLVLFDLDGTLLLSSRRVHGDNIRAIERLQSAGVRVGFATGRSPRSVESTVVDVRANAPCIHMNGGLVRDPRDARVIFRRTLTTKTALAAVSAARDLALHWNVYVGDDIWIERHSPAQRESEVKDGVPHVLVPDLVERIANESVAPLKIMFIAPVAVIPVLHARVAAALSNESDAAALVNSEPTYLEVLPAHCSKGDACRALVDDLGLTMSDVMAFGDNLNDLELLTSAGFGVAMANSHARVLERVPNDGKRGAHIGHHETDAIARFLDAWDAKDGAVRRREET